MMFFAFWFRYVRPGVCRAIGNQLEKCLNGASDIPANLHGDSVAFVEEVHVFETSSRVCDHFKRFQESG